MLLHSQNLCIQPSLQCSPNICSSTSVNFQLPVLPLLVQEIILTIPTNTHKPPQFFNSLYFCFRSTIPTIYTKSISLPHPFSQFRLHQAAREIGSLVRTNTVLFSPLTLKVWTVTTRLTITDSSSIFCSYLTQ